MLSQGKSIMYSARRSVLARLVSRNRVMINILRKEEAVITTQIKQGIFILMNAVSKTKLPTKPYPANNLFANQVYKGVSL